MKTPLSVIQLLIQSNQWKEPNSIVEWQKVKIECDKLNFSLNQLLTYSRSTKLFFELFYTGTKGRTKGEATGIGFYLVKSILTTLNHPYHLHSKNNETTFTIDLSQSIETATK